jgi:hypothetical protein
MWIERWIGGLKMPDPIPGNVFDPIYDQYDASRWDPVGIAHYQLIIDKNVPEKLEFATKEISNSVPPTSILDYAYIIANKTMTAEEKIEAVSKLENPEKMFIGGSRDETSLSYRINSPYNMPVLNQCWLLLELDPSVKNWQFEKGYHSVTSKHVADKYDFSLVDVYSGNASHADGVVGGQRSYVKYDSCRVVFWGVARREYKGSRLFNIHTEFKQGSAATERRLKVVFDPDVPNDGNNAFP